MTQGFYSERRRDGRSFHCPNGHKQWYCDSDKAKFEKARAEAERMEKRADYWRKTANSAERSVSAQKGVVTRIKNRVAKGICPCCNRTFKNLGRHMQSKHPDYTEGS